MLKYPIKIKNNTIVKDQKDINGLMHKNFDDCWALSSCLFCDYTVPREDYWTYEPSDEVKNRYKDRIRKGDYWCDGLFIPARRINRQGEKTHLE